MPKEIFPSSYECDCGHVSDFFENTIREAKYMSLRRPINLLDSTANEHTIIFSGGQMVDILCPDNQGRPRSGAPKTPPVRKVKRGFTGGTEKPPKRRFTEKQGQYLAFIYLYNKLNKRPPAEMDIQRYFNVTPPSVHQMILTLEKGGLIERTPGQARSIRLLVQPKELPELE